MLLKVVITDWQFHLQNERKLIMRFMLDNNLAQNTGMDVADVVTNHLNIVGDWMLVGDSEVTEFMNKACELKQMFKCAVSVMVC